MKVSPLFTSPLANHNAILCRLGEVVGDVGTGIVILLEEVISIPEKVRDSHAQVSFLTRRKSAL
jgi:hypothetical protein